MKKKLRILQIEDSKDDSDLIELHLSEAGYWLDLVRVETAEQMAEALNDKNDWDLVLSDFSLPTFSAPLALTELKRSGRDIPFIVISGTIGEERAVSTMRAGAKDFVIKHDLSRLVPIIERELREAESRKMRRKIDRVYKESEQRYRQIVNTAREGICIIDSDSKISFANKALAEMLGQHEQEILGQKLAERFADSSPIKGKDFLKTLKAQGAGQIEIKLNRTEGFEISCIVSFSKIADSGNENYLAMITDITERQLLSEAGLILSSSLDYKQTVKRLAELVTARFADWCRIDILEPGNQFPTVLAVHHVDPEKRSWSESYLQKFPTDWNSDQGAAAVFRTGKVLRFEKVSDEMLEQVIKDNEQRDQLRKLGFRSALVVPIASRSRIMGVLTLVSAESGRHFSEYDLILAQDLAQRIALAADNAFLYADAQAVNTAKDQFLATLSHELRTPLNVILGWIEMLKNEQLDKDTYDQALQTLDRNAKIQKELIEDLLDVSRIITGKFAVDPKPLQINQIISAVVSSSKLKAASKSLTVKAVVPEQPLFVMGDQLRLEQVVSNLVENAIKFTPSGGSITVEVKKGNGYAEIWFCDTGIGIEPSFLPRVFESLQQEDMGTTRAHGGLGLGLSITKHIVEKHRGTISAMSEGRNKGARFKVTLPTIELSEPATNKKTFKVSEKRLDSVKILVVDDSPDVLVLISLWLKRAGAQVKSVATAKAALEQLDAFKPDILLSDIGMPEEDGYSLITKVRARSEANSGKVKAAALSAYAREEEKLLAIKAGFNIHLSKPITESALIDAMAALSLN